MSTQAPPSMTCPVCRGGGRLIGLPIAPDGKVPRYAEALEIECENCGGIGQVPAEANSLTSWGTEGLRLLEEIENGDNILTALRQHFDLLLQVPAGGAVNAELLEALQKAWPVLHGLCIEKGLDPADLGYVTGGWEAKEAVRIAIQRAGRRPTVGSEAPR